MKKLSKKQLEVLKILFDDKTEILFVKGLDAHCFISSRMYYPISTATLFALKEQKMISIIEEDWKSCVYAITSLGIDNLIK